MSDSSPFLMALMALLAGLWLSSAPALAQEPSTLERPPPQPLYERGDEAEQDEAAGGRLSGADAQMKWPRITPSVAISGHIGFIDEEFDWPGVGLWLGANYYPWPDRYNAFWSVGLKLERNQELRDRPYAFVPTLRSGFAALKGDPRRFKNQLFANVQIYALLGRHIPFDELPLLWRAGVGVISPRLVPANAMMLLWGVPLPNHLEVVVDIAPDGQTKEVLLMFGIGL